MTNPRLIAEDVAQQYISKRSSQFPHSKNIRRHLRLPLLAVTRRILLPRVNYSDVEQSQIVGSFGNDAHFDPTFAKCKVSFSIYCHSWLSSDETHISFSFL